MEMFPPVMSVTTELVSPVVRIVLKETKANVQSVDTRNAISNSALQ